MGIRDGQVGGKTEARPRSPILAMLRDDVRAALLDDLDGPDTAAVIFRRYGLEKHAIRRGTFFAFARMHRLWRRRRELLGGRRPAVRLDRRGRKAREGSPRDLPAEKRAVALGLVIHAGFSAMRAYDLCALAVDGIRARTWRAFCHRQVKAGPAAPNGVPRQVEAQAVVALRYLAALLPQWNVAGAIDRMRALWRRPEEVARASTAHAEAPA